MDIKEKINYWIEIALDDLDSADIMLKKKKYLQSGFYCHQSVEKILKGYFWFIKQEDPPFTHNLLKLSKESGIDNLIDDTQKKLLDLLMPLNIEARYPDEKMRVMKTLDNSKAERIYKETEEIVTWIHKLITQ
ncbi:MAG TPA: HEPN domain-containing protein [Spirochaetota bacterium]|nr:HEPN domain-containing protein [Spirochaetota bacterium]HPJ36318.1 HEPN domain-containing protein [Spirochaetota bacterium]